MPYKTVILFAALVLLFQQAESTSGFSYNALNSGTNSFISDDFKTYGSGFVNGSGVILTQKGDPFGTIIFYNSSLYLGNGFYTEFTLQITNCDTGPYFGADGFAFVIYPQLPAPFNVPGGSNIGITTSSNVAAVGFILVNDILTVCAVNSSATLGGGSLKDDTTHCLQNTTMSVLQNLRCNGTHVISIAFSRPTGDWEIVIDQTYTYLFTKDIVPILNWNSGYTAYVGFSGGVGAGYMDQRILAWNFTYSGCEGLCAANANCNYSTSPLTCYCPPGFVGDGYSQCIPIKTSANIVPILECYEKYGDGTYDAYYGYDSKETEPVVIPKGDNNGFYGFNGTIDPTELFMPGRSPYYPSNAFIAEFTLPASSDPITLTWHLGNYEVSFSTDDISKRCSPDLLVLLQFTTGRQLSANETSLILDQLYNLLGVSFGRISIRNITYSPFNAKRQSGVELAELELEISGTNSTTQNEPRAADVVQQLINASSNTTLMNEVINPDPNNQDPDRSFVGVKTTSSGTETSGQVVLQPTAPSSSSNPIASTNPIATSSASHGHFISTFFISSTAMFSWLLLC